MPGTMRIDEAATFAACLLMAAGPKTEFGTDTQAISKTGERKWAVQAAVTYHPEYGMAAQSEVIQVTVTGGTDPALVLQPGTPVTFDGLRVGFSAPERGQGDRIRGGRPWFQASGVRAVHGQRNAEPKAA